MTFEEKRIINQGDIFWVQNDSESDFPHPHVVIQENLFNHSRVHTVIVCSLTTNMNRKNLQGNILLDAGEGNLPKQSIVEVSKVSSIEKVQLGEYIGSLSENRIKQILSGLQFLQISFFKR